MKRTIIFTLIPLLAAPIVAQADSIRPSWGTHDRSKYDFSPYERVSGGAHLDIDIGYGDRGGYYDRDWDHRGCPPGLAKKGNGCMPPGQAKKHW